jgi:Ribbon-helix-helix protein, copG family
MKSGDKPDDGVRVSVRASGRMLERLDELAAERGIDRSRLVRQLLEAGLRDRPPPPSEPLDEDEILALLTEKARSGNVSALRTLLAREQERDPHEAALIALQKMAEARRQ